VAEHIPLFRAASESPLWLASAKKMFSGAELEFSSYQLRSGQPNESTASMD
jgi:hypothetical protein